MMTIPERLTIDWLRWQYLNHQLSPQVVIEEIIRRSLADQRFNIWITPPDIERLTPYLKRLENMDIEAAPLWGIPFAVKDNIDVNGMTTTAGCPAYAYLPETDAAVVAKLLAAGAIPLGKTNLDQFATGLVGTRSPYGETHNALNEEMISGGSSSGSAVAVARGQAVFALGTDTAGSGRVPAALNDIYGLKPSCGAWSIMGVVPACLSLDCLSVFANCREDVFAVDRVVRGIEAADPWSRRIVPPLTPLPKRLCLPSGPPAFFGPHAKGYEAAWLRAEAKLINLGFKIERIDEALFAKAAAILYEGPWIAERWASLGDFVRSHPEDVHEVTATILRSGAKLDAAALFQAMHQLAGYRRETRDLLQDAVLVMPTAGGIWSREEVRRDPFGTNRDMGRYTNHCNLLDLCALSIPAGLAGERAAFGITLFGLSGREPWLSAIAREFSNEWVPLAVCGLHMRGFPLEHQMLQNGAYFIRNARTAREYQLLKLPTTPVKPGLIRKGRGGAAIDLEIWAMPQARLGMFMQGIAAPLGIGCIRLSDDTWVLGFLCQEYAATDAEDISAFGGWRHFMNASLA